MIDPRKLTRFQLEELIRWFCHHMPSERRTEFIQTYPQTYNALHERTIAEVRNVARDVDPAEPE